MQSISRFSRTNNATGFAFVSYPEADARLGTVGVAISRHLVEWSRADAGGRLEIESIFRVQCLVVKLLLSVSNPFELK